MILKNKIKLFLEKMLKRLKKIVPYSLVYRLSLFYRYFFDRNAFTAHKHYLLTDEVNKSVHILESINYLKISKLPLVYYEFGCHSARTFSSAIRASKELGIFDDFKFYAFDSFEGLPKTSEEDGSFKTGTFKTNLAEFKEKVYMQSNFRIADKNIIPGFYSDSLSKELQDTLPKAGVIHIDVDLYSSAKEVLNFIAPLIVDGSVLLFDDFYCFPAGSNMGEERALNEFIETNNHYRLIEWKAYSSFGKSFFITRKLSKP